MAIAGQQKTGAVRKQGPHHPLCVPPTRALGRGFDNRCRSCRVVGIAIRAGCADFSRRADIAQPAQQTDKRRNTLSGTTHFSSARRLLYPSLFVARMPDDSIARGARASSIALVLAIVEPESPQVRGHRKRFAPTQHKSCKPCAIRDAGDRLSGRSYFGCSALPAVRLQSNRRGGPAPTEASTMAVIEPAPISMERGSRIAVGALPIITGRNAHLRHHARSTHGGRHRQHTPEPHPRGRYLGDELAGGPGSWEPHGPIVLRQAFDGTRPPRSYEDYVREQAEAVSRGAGMQNANSQAEERAQ